MREMQTNSVLNIQGPRLQSETVRITLEPLTTEESSRIWALFPAANYRTSVAYLVSPVWIDPEVPEAEGMPVTIDRLRAGSKAQVPV
jgi:DNA-binding response OmpR family regulator